MNLWECDFPGCKSKSVGVGGAIGLRAIGWYFKIGKGLFCPNHIPYPTEICKDYGDVHGKCPYCTAEKWASNLQKLIEEIDFLPFGNNPLKDKPIFSDRDIESLAEKLLKIISYQLRRIGISK